jgi:hypothetical protein
LPPPQETGVKTGFLLLTDNAKLKRQTKSKLKMSDQTELQGKLSSAQDLSSAESASSSKLLDFSDAELLAAETDDGAALRLAVKLGITVIPDAFMHWGYITQTKFRRTDNYTCPYETHGDDSMKATRKAIVRAATDPGRART